MNKPLENYKKNENIKEHVCEYDILNVKIKNIKNIKDND